MPQRRRKYAGKIVIKYFFMLRTKRQEMFFPSPNIVVFSPSGVIKWGQICYTVTQKSTNNTVRRWRARVPGAVDMFLLSPALPPQHCNPEATKPYWLFTLKVFFLANGITEVQNCHHYV